MQKNGNLYLQTDTSLSVASNEENKMENKIDVLSIKKNETQKKSKNDLYDHKHQVTNFIREEIILQHRPPKGSLSELVFNNAINELKELLINFDENDTENFIDPNCTDSVGSTFSWTPLYWGVKLRRLECVQLLLDFGVDINVVVNDCEECCGTVLDLATLRDDYEMEDLLRTYAEKEDVNLGQSFKAIRTKLRGKAPAFNFRYYGKNKKDSEAA